MCPAAVGLQYAADSPTPLTRGIPPSCSSYYYNYIILYYIILYYIILYYIILYYIILYYIILYYIILYYYIIFIILYYITGPDSGGGGARGARPPIFGLAVPNLSPTLHARTPMTPPVPPYFQILDPPLYYTILYYSILYYILF